MSDIRCSILDGSWIMQKRWCSISGQVCYLSLAARRLARSSNHSRQPVDQFNRSKTGRVPLTGGGAEVAWRQSPSRGGIVLPIQAGVKTKVFALLIQFGRTLLAVIEAKRLAVFET